MLTTSLAQSMVSEFGSIVTSGQVYQYGCKIGQPKLYNEFKKTVNQPSRGRFDLGSFLGNPVATVTSPKLSKEQISNNIRERFEALELLTDGVIAGNINAMIVTGAPGVGKSYTLEKKLKKAVSYDNIKSVNTIKGSISGAGLYIALYENREVGQVLVLDDIDTIFNDLEALNLLKGALDTSAVREISWKKESSFLRDNDIPNSFEFQGSVIFISNTDFDGQIARETSKAPHLAALVSRSVFMDLCIHKNEDIIIRIEQVLIETDMSKDLGLTLSQHHEIIGFLRENVEKLRSVSLRTVVQLAGYMKTTGDWNKLARMTLLKKGAV